ncbi:hypothetical protein TUM4438_39940 [Shewanella sairae]|uniref:Abi family protein n=1 Tax=Shewanella sairae TaxID=190310 RepID=A0ABQ4PQJ2_9GAMM|nr:Abi family protein [Shewanella sairae]MCL1132218.1 Abi family protein [Shewanella sairae]GIU51189.1 hypothetical protein TUM4438_39940 [Shewanella sairae]
MPYQAIEQTLSVSRLSTYRNAIRAAHGQDCLKTSISLYEWNADLSAHFLVAIHIYEFTLRNAISEAISLRYGADWPINVTFQNSLPAWQKSELLGLDEVINYQSIGKVLPELRPFWFENMLRQANDLRIWAPFIHQVFPYADGITPQQVRSSLKDGCFKIRKLRNRIAHHEPIFKQTTLQQAYPLITEAIQWRCQDTKRWLDKIERITPLLSSPII